MSFESGVFGFRIFHLPRGLPRDAVARFARRAAPALDALKRGAAYGWVTGRHLLDRNITDDTAHVAGYLRLTLLRAERRIPPALLRAECRMAELAEMQASGADALPRARRAAIRKETTERLLPAMPPTLTGIPMVYDPAARVLYAGALSDAQCDVFRRAVREALDEEPVPVTPEVAALARKKKNARDLSPTSFSERLEDALAGGGLGEDFLTWLWFCSEERGGAAGDEGGFTFGLDGPLTLVMEGEGAHVVMMRKGVPLLSTEAKAALTAGKKLASAVLLAARGELSWRVTLDARAFVFRGVKLPEGERLDAISLFQQRMVALDALREGVLAAFDAFVEERFDPAEWRRTRNAMRRWVAGRAERF